MSKALPLNGVKTHPLTVYAKGVLREIGFRPLPVSGLNPGVMNRLMREELVRVIGIASPFKSHKGKIIDHVTITDAGKEALK